MQNNMKKYIGYYRVSSTHQVNKENNISLGIEAQKTAVANFINNSGIMINEFVEVESGKNNNRPILGKAIEEAKKTGACLIIAKIDRLSRELSFLFQLRDQIQQSGIEIKSLDIPDMSTLNLGIYGTIAQHERETISKRTKVALSELKKQGVKLGTPENLNYEAQLKGVEVRKNNARNNDRNRQATAIITSMREKGATFQKIADYLNNLNFKTRRDKSFTSMGVKLLYDRNSSENNL